MSAHLATERLSAYLDHELEDHELRLVEAHVSECAHCQHRLSGLRRVVERLQRMPAASPPAVLGSAIERDVSQRWRDRREEARRGRHRGGFELVQGPVRLGFAMVAGLAIIFLLYAHWISREGMGATRLVLPAAPAAAASPERVETGGRAFVLAHGSWWQESLLGPGEVVARASALSVDTALQRVPWIAPLLARAPVVLELDGAVTVVRPGQDPPAARPPSTVPDGN